MKTSVLAALGRKIRATLTLTTTSTSGSMTSEGGRGTAPAACERLMREGVLAKDTHETTIRLAPPLCITRDELQWALDRIVPALETASARS